MTALYPPARRVELRWTVVVGLLMFLSVAGPFVFGLPVNGDQSCIDGNFALELTKDYMAALRGGVWLPHWLPSTNNGFGSPAFYFYGRLPFLVAAYLGNLLHLGPVGALIAGFLVFRFIAFFTCRAWLLPYSGKRAADIGALVFLALPFAMSFNPITRVGFAETAATAFVPLLFLALDAVLVGRNRMAWAVPVLALVYALLAVIHPLQVVLAFAVSLLYVLVWGSARGVLVNFCGLGLGLLVAGASWLPALSMQSMINATAWTSTFWIELWNNFLFTPLQFRIWRLNELNIWIYGTWLLCAGVIVVCLRTHNAAWRDQAPRQRVQLLCLAVVLVAMTGLARPFWSVIHSLRIIQFPWRLFPCGLAITGGLMAGWTASNLRRQRKVLFLVSGLIVVQCLVVMLGGYLSFSNVRKQHHVSSVLLTRVPLYVPRAQRMLPAYADRRNYAAEYLTAGAHAAGWHLDDNNEHMVPSRAISTVPALPAGLRVTTEADGSVAVRGFLGQPTTILLPQLYFPDEVTVGGAARNLSLDEKTGLAKLDLPAGQVTLAMTHDGVLPALERGRRMSVLGAFLLLLCLLLEWRAERGASAAGDMVLKVKSRFRSANPTHGSELTN